MIVYTMQAKTNRVGLTHNYASTSIEGSDYIILLWPSTIKCVANRKVARDVWLDVRKCIWKTTSWNDLVDSLSIHVYITKSQYEALIKGKHKKDDGNESSSKKTMKLDKDWQQILLVHGKVMNDTSK